jgi:hypothetical protein
MIGAGEVVCRMGWDGMEKIQRTDTELGSRILYV